MSPEAKRIAIARLCDIQPRRLWRIWYEPEEYDGWEDIPDYFSDLNAMREARKQLTPLQRVKYLGFLYGIVDTHGQRPQEDDWKIHDATAAECADAFLLACGCMPRETASTETTT